MSIVMVKAGFKMEQVKGKVIQFLVSEKSNETSDKGAWLFWSLMLGLIAALVLKIAFGTGFASISSIFTGITSGTTAPTGGWGN